MNYLINPTLDLFVYRLAEGLGDDEDQRTIYRERYLSNFPVALQDLLRKAFDKKAETSNPQYVPLLKLVGFDDNVYPINEEIKIDNLPIDRYYYPVQLSDTYGFLFEACIQGKTDITAFHKLEEEALKPLINQPEKLDTFQEGNIGKTWIISGRRLDTDPMLPTEIAKEAYKAFMEGKSAEMQLKADWQNCQKGKFLGAEIFEIWQAPQQWKSMDQNLHVIIIIYGENHPSDGEISVFYDDWMQLFCYRNKIIWAYGCSRELKRQLHEGFQAIRETIKTLKTEQKLDRLQATLQDNLEKFSDYRINLQALKIQINTIEVNLKNYKNWLQITTEVAQKIAITNLERLRDDFNKITVETYQEQIKQDYDTLSAGGNTIDNLIDTIKGIVEIAQARSNGKFQNFVQIIGTGIGSAAVVASSSANFAKDIKATPLISNTLTHSPLSKEWSELTITLGLSIIAGLLMSGLTALFLWCIKPRRPVLKQLKNSKIT